MVPWVIHMTLQQWLHMRVITSQINDNSTVNSMGLVRPDNTENPKAPHYWHIVKGIQRWLVDSPYKGSVMRKAVPCHDVITSYGSVTNQWFVWDSRYAWVYIVFNLSPPSGAYMRQWIGSALVQIMTCRLFGAKSLSKPMLCYCQLNP